ncbi:MAG TPA: hypothetical protein PLV72_01795 [Candidatus Magasanikbacteria bacterium]|nr:hypothetical protein [Candidatus Magasanikbacteria bacterium]
MRLNREPIEIQEPAIGELRKRRSCSKRACASGCGCFALFLILSVLILKFTAEPRPKTIKSVPENFPKDIPVYDRDSIEKITETKGNEKGRAMEIIAIGPKIILSPILIAIDKRVKHEDGASSTYWTKLVALVKEPVADHRDTVEILWTEMPAEPNFVAEYYEKELAKHDYVWKNISKTTSTLQYSFKKDNTDGILYIDDKNRAKGTDYASLRIDYPTDVNSATTTTSTGQSKIK